MSHHIECRALINDQPVKFKKDLRNAVANDPSTVWFESVGGLFSSFSGGVDDIPDGTVLIVVGPNPWQDRRWFATVAEGRVSS